MAVRTAQEIIDAITDAFSNDDSDETIALIEDVSDTLNSFTSDDSVNWEQKYHDNDAMWRKKYKERFSNVMNEPEPESEPETEEKKMTFSDLFKTV